VGERAWTPELESQFWLVLAIFIGGRKVSCSFAQRKLQVGYNSTATCIERMEKVGIVGPSNNVGMRELLVHDFREARALIANAEPTK